MRIFSLIILIISVFWLSPLQAQQTPKNRFHFELEPLQFVNNGWSIVGHYAVNNRLQIGTNAFASVLSEGLNGLAFDASGELDFQARQTFGINLSLRYFLQQKPYQEGWVVSLPIGWERWNLRTETLSEGKRYSFWYLSPRIGYLWYPFQQKRFYLLGEAVGIVPIIRDNPVDFEEISVEIRTFIPLPSLGLGLAF